VSGGGISAKSERAVQRTRPRTTTVVVKLYKYRDFSKPNDEAYRRLSQILYHNTFWCAAPSSLNDPEEFFWSCDFEPTDSTVSLFAQMLVKYQNITPAKANRYAEDYVRTRQLEARATRVIQKEIIERCRREIGLACFGTSAENAICWERYGGAGAGICIEIEAPSDLVGKQIFYVRYPEKKSLNIDQLLRSVLDSSPRKQVYEMALLCKPPYWASEAEIRFVSKRQNVSVCLDGSRISSLVLGPNLTVEALRRIKRIAESLPYQLPLIMHKS
jgi:hypothetical protein